MAHTDAAVAHTDAAVAHTDAAVAHSDAAVAHTDAAVAHSDAVVAHTDAAVAHSDASVTYTVATVVELSGTLQDKSLSAVYDVTLSDMVSMGISGVSSTIFPLSFAGLFLMIFLVSSVFHTCFAVHQQRQHSSQNICKACTIASGYCDSTAALLPALHLAMDRVAMDALLPVLHLAVD